MRPREFDRDAFTRLKEAAVFERKRERAPDQAGADDGELAHSTDLTTEDTEGAEETILVQFCNRG